MNTKTTLSKVTSAGALLLAVATPSTVAVSTVDTASAASSSTTRYLTTAQENAFRAKIVASAARQNGVRYTYAGASPSTGFDCSGLTSYVYRQSGVSLPRTVGGQRAALRYVSRATVKKGDLIFKGTSHTGIVADPARKLMWHAPKPGDRVKLVSYNNSYYAGATFGTVVVHR